MKKLYGEPAILYAVRRGHRVQLFYEAPSPDGRQAPRPLPWEEVRGLAGEDPGGISCEELPADLPDLPVLQAEGDLPSRAERPLMPVPVPPITAYCPPRRRGLPS